MGAERVLAAFLFALASSAPLAAELGTLFHTAAERAQIDRMRRGEPATPRPSSGPATPVAPVAGEVTGFVRRSDGRNTVWIDGRPVATTNPKNNPLFDPRIVRDAAPDLPPASVKVVPETPAKPAR